MNVLQIDGPRDVEGKITNQQVLWWNSHGLHAYDLTGPTDPFNAFNRERMENSDLDQDGGNDIRSILIADEQVIIGSAANTGFRGQPFNDIWHSEGHTRIPPIQSIALGSINNVSKLYAGINPGRFANIAPIDPLSNDSDEDGML